MKFPHVEVRGLVKRLLTPSPLLKKDEVTLETHRTRAEIMGVMIPLTAMGFGLLMCFSEGDDWIGRSLALAMFFLYAPTLWGVMLFFAGTVMFCGSVADNPRMVVLGARGCGIWFFAAALIAVLKGLNPWDPIVTAVAFTWINLAVNCYVNAQSRVAD